MTDSFVLTLDYGGTKISVGTATTEGELIARRDLKTSDFGDAQAVVMAGIRTGQKLVDELCSTYRDIKFVSIGVSTMGITYEDHVLLAPNVPGWSDLSMGTIFSTFFPKVPIRFENDVKCAALVELRRGELQHTDYGIYVNLGTGIMVVLTHGNNIMQGHHGASGEIAYNLRAPRDKRGFSHGAAPLEEFVGGRFIGARGRKYFNRPIAAVDIFAMYREGSPDAKAFINETFTELAYHLANLCNVWNPQKVVFGAGMVGAHDILFPIFSNFFEKYVPFPPVLSVAKFNRDAGLHGAIELALMELDSRSQLNTKI